MLEGETLSTGGSLSSLLEAECLRGGTGLIVWVISSEMGRSLSRMFSCMEEARHFVRSHSCFCCTQQEQVCATDVELECSAGAHVVALFVQLHLFRLSVLWIQGTAAQEVDAMREAQLSAFCVGFKVYQQGLRETAWEQCMKGKRNVRTHREQASKGPTKGSASKREVVDDLLMCGE